MGLLYLFIFYCPKRSTCFGVFIKPSLGAGVKTEEKSHLICGLYQLKSRIDISILIK
jgi:hypothetical protein